jgi:hypothetical protein
MTFPEAPNSIFREGMLLNQFASPAIAVCPIWALGATLTFWIINALFVGTTDEALNHHHRSNRIPLDELDDLPVDRGVEANVRTLRIPSFQVGDFLVFLAEHDANGDF